ncbi:CGNR zinc finger domain-containing protein [Saccharothrix yanglingensis]|uniref:CGNR zinc finger domain-containing protein n=1 Tax=Saccharothrix yanglingensis TaxID=659496 RepID=UPI0027D2FAA0|nr:ABATE domain-containing protein [Saccharothrix yanglingensis]
MPSTEPRPIRLANTVRRDRSTVRDHLTTAADLAAWLSGNDVGADAGTRVAAGDITAEDLAAFRELRTAVRDLAAALTDDPRPIARDADVERAVGAVNRAAIRADTRPQLEVVSGRLRRTTATTAGPVAAALAATAAEAVDLFTGDERELLRACHAPGCVLYFVKDHPRREWCSTGCGNRARAARHYRRTSGATAG